MIKLEMSVSSRRVASPRVINIKDLRQLAQKLSRLLSGHRLASFVVTAGALILVAGAIGGALSGEPEADVFTWTALALMAYAVFAVVYFRRRAPQDVRVAMTWFLGVSPAIYGIGAVLVGSPVVVMWMGVALAIGLIGWLAVSDREATA